MKISVLIPTRDRLELLRSAVDSVLRLDDEDCEVVISDNASSQDVGPLVEALADPRVVLVRTTHALAVTDNWNNALAHSSGDYVIMLGDDDALLGTYFARARALIAEFDEPQVIYHNALVYAYPGVVPDAPAGYLRSEGYADFLRDAHEPFVLDPVRASAMALAATRFRVRYGFNMQFVTVRRSAIEDLSRDGPFFRSPFPDYYAMNHLFLRAQRIVVDPHPTVVIGVSPRSYGFFHNNEQEQAGRSFLQGDGEGTDAFDRSEPLLPGTNINDGWLEAMRSLHQELGSPPELRPAYARYRRLQIAYMYNGRYLRRSITSAELATLRPFTTWWERALYAAIFRSLGRLARISAGRSRGVTASLLQLAERQFPAWDPVRDEATYANIDEVVARVDPDAEPLRWQQPRRPGVRSAIVRRLG
jgi:glycosyltransferase involved in cell wall biosynthesis